MISIWVIVNLEHTLISTTTNRIKNNKTFKREHLYNKFLFTQTY